jgi:hypothetical protein
MNDNKPLESFLSVIGNTYFHVLTFRHASGTDSSVPDAAAARRYADLVTDYADDIADDYTFLAEFLSQAHTVEEPYYGPNPVQRSVHQAPFPPQTVRFASVFRVSAEGVTQVPFDTTNEFCELDDSILLPDRESFVIVLLQGFPSPQWLNLLGARFQIDPEFFRRHVKSTPFGPVVTLPSCQGWMVSLQIPRLVRQVCTKQPIQVARVRSARAVIRHHEDLWSPHRWEPTSIPLAECVIQNISVLARGDCCIEQKLSIGVHRVETGWIGTLRPPRRT